jgi:ferric-dicitrate binding protein FerR (iron transport regulator)
VKAYNDESNIDVTLSEGRVQVSLENGISAVQMKPMDQVSFDKFKRTFTKRSIDVKSYTGWKDNRLYFNGETFEAISRQLERKFNVHIHIASDKLKNTAFTGDFVRGENLDQILKVMTQDDRINCKRDGDQIYITETK